MPSLFLMFWQIFLAVLQALGFPMPYFAHVSLILAPDRSKLSKRHGATSVGQVVNHGAMLYPSFKELGAAFVFKLYELLLQ